MTKNKTLDHALAKFQFSKGQQLLLLLCNYIQLVHITSTLCLLVFPWIDNTLWRAGTVAMIFYLLPPLLARLTLRLLPIRFPCIGLGSNLGQSRTLLHDAWFALAGHPDVTL
ncbi:MAG: hypothetical protein D3924_17755, partial [Candidatus Electrothrix sp. AR4]|nr:hypothetical protein [Candidatus Electrothrix sp. AR4]